jgi:ectoine hydroxylase
MLLKNQIEFYRENGFLILNTVFSNAEIEAYNKKLSVFENHKDKPSVVCESNGSIRSIFAPEKQEPYYLNLVRDKHILKASEQLVGDNLYLYQYKLNIKEAFVGQNWEWHQDFPFWHFGDGIKNPELISVMILLNDVASYQGPLILIPKSHSEGIVSLNEKPHLENNNDLKNSLNTDLKYNINDELVKEFAQKNDIVTFSGKKGSVLFFHPNLFHASNTNVSPFTRNTAIITYNSVNNIPEKKSPRPDYVCYPDHTALTTL